MYNGNKDFFYVIGNNVERFCIRKLTSEDIEKIAIARKMQETENGNGATKAYILEYKKILQNLFAENKVIGAGAFYGEDLVSLAFYNLINYGSEKKIPYLCGVWTKPEYRKKGLAIQVYKKLMEEAYERKDEMQADSIVTIEGNEAAYNLYKKLGYSLTNNEMTFLDDVKSPQTDIEVIRLATKDNIGTEVFLDKEKAKMLIQFSTEQFFSHPFNINGIMNRIKRIRLLDEKITFDEFKVYMQKFFSKHRFCKFNIQELIENENLGRLFGKNKISEEYLVDVFEHMNFEGKNGETVNIKRSKNIMKKSIINEFEYMDRCIYESR